MQRCVNYNADLEAVGPYSSSLKSIITDAGIQGQAAIAYIYFYIGLVNFLKALNFPSNKGRIMRRTLPLPFNTFDEIFAPALYLIFFIKHFFHNNVIPNTQ